eukprot:COSAG06_NODE_673_length_13189_cov_211.299312_11_plen_137_part_00
MVWQTMGMTKDQIKGKVSSGEWRNAMFDIMEMFYRSIFLPYTNGELDGKFNLPHNYEINNDQSMMDALAPEWSAATAKQLGASETSRARSGLLRSGRGWIVARVAARRRRARPSRPRGPFGPPRRGRTELGDRAPP